MVRRVALWALLLVVLVPVTGCVVLVADETYAYAVRSEERAKAEAEELFALAGKRMKFDPSWFAGPTRSVALADSDARSGSFSFEWRADPRFKDKINPALIYFVFVSYLPYTREYWWDYDYSYYYRDLK